MTQNATSRLNGTRTNKTRTIIEKALEDMKRKGKKSVDSIDVHFATGLSFEKISPVMEALEKEGVILPCEEFR